MNDGIKQMAARIRNLFSLGEFQKRYDDGKVQVKTIFGRVVEKREAFPYGFKAKAKKGTVLVLCQGGNFDGVEILPVLDYEGGPELEAGDAALYTESGGWIIIRENGGIEAEAESGGVTVKTKAGKFFIGEDGNVEINGDSKSFVTFEDLETALNTFLTSLNAHTHTVSTSGGPAAQTGTAAPMAPPLTLNISAAKTAQVKTA
ncbi:MAG: hypothetical protein LBI67_08495 [Treponema sp.]|jgi:phage gp45-like|nr:hypothetical protein [Treponema sp.]